MNNGNRPAPQDLGPRERSMVEATLTLLQNAAAWPTFDELDKYADNHLGIADASEVLTGIPPTYIRGLHGLSSIPGDRKIELTARAVASCPHGVELTQAFVHAIESAASAEQNRIGSEPEVALTPDGIADRSPAAGREDLLRQLGQLLAAENWGWSSAATDYPGASRLAAGSANFEASAASRNTWSGPIPRKRSAELRTLAMPLLSGLDDPPHRTPP